MSSMVSSTIVAGLKLGGNERGGNSLNVITNLKTSSIRRPRQTRAIAPDQNLCPAIKMHTRPVPSRCESRLGGGFTRFDVRSRTLQVGPQIAPESKLPWPLQPPSSGD